MKEAVLYVMSTCFSKMVRNQDDSMFCGLKKYPIDGTNFFSFPNVTYMTNVITRQNYFNALTLFSDMLSDKIGP